MQNQTTKIEEYLKSKNINYKIQVNGSGRQAVFPCPYCKHPSFGINIDTGLFQCFRQNKCGIKGGFIDFQRILGDEPLLIPQKRTYSLPTSHYKEIDNKAVEFLLNRKITGSTIHNFKDMLAVSERGDEVLFLYKKNNILVNIKHRKISEKFFYQDKNCIPILWNQDNIDNNILYITEGEMDCLALFEYGYAGVSIPDGVNNKEWIENDFDFLSKFKTIYLIFDNDFAGQSVIEDIVVRLGKWRCKNVLLPYKDVNECLINNLPKEKFDEYINNAKDFDIKELKTTEYFTNEIIEYRNNPEKFFGFKTGFNKLNDIIRGWRQGEVTVWSGRNGTGKSTLFLNEAIHLINNGKKVLMGSFEMPPRRYLNWLVIQSLYKSNPTNEEIRYVLERYSGYLYIINYVGEINPDYLYEIIEFSARKYGIEFIFIDSLMKINLSPDSHKFYGEQKNFINSLSSLSKEFKNHIHLIAHPRKGLSDDGEPDKDDIYGSIDITNIADNVIFVSRIPDEKKEELKNKNKEWFDCNLFVKKNREFGDEGKVGLYFNKETKTFYEENMEVKKSKPYETKEDLLAQNYYI